MIQVKSGQIDIKFSINNSIHKTTCRSPSILLFGVSQRGKVQDEIKEYLDANINVSCRNLELIREKAKIKTEKNQESYKKQADKNEKVQLFIQKVIF